MNVYLHPLPNMLFLDSFQMKASNRKKDEYVKETKMPNLNAFENIVENGAIGSVE